MELQSEQKCKACPNPARSNFKTCQICADKERDRKREKRKEAKATSTSTTPASLTPASTPRELASKRPLPELAPEEEKKVAPPTKIARVDKLESKKSAQIKQLQQEMKQLKEEVQKLKRDLQQEMKQQIQKLQQDMKQPSQVPLPPPPDNIFFITPEEEAAVHATPPPWEQEKPPAAQKEDNKEEEKLPPFPYSKWDFTIPGLQDKVNDLNMALNDKYAEIRHRMIVGREQKPGDPEWPPLDTLRKQGVVDACVGEWFVRQKRKAHWALWNKLQQQQQQTPPATAAETKTKPQPQQKKPNLNSNSNSKTADPDPKPDADSDIPRQTDAEKAASAILNAKYFSDPYIDLEVMTPRRLAQPKAVQDILKQETAELLDEMGHYYKQIGYHAKFMESVTEIIHKNGQTLPKARVLAEEEKKKHQEIQDKVDCDKSTVGWTKRTEIMHDYICAMLSRLFLPRLLQLKAKHFQYPPRDPLPAHLAPRECEKKFQGQFEYDFNGWRDYICQRTIKEFQVKNEFVPANELEIWERQSKVFEKQIFEAWAKAEEPKLPPALALPFPLSEDDDDEGEDEEDEEDEEEEDKKKTRKNKQERLRALHKQIEAEKLEFIERKTNGPDREEERPGDPKALWKDWRTMTQAQFFEGLHDHYEDLFAKRKRELDDDDSSSSSEDDR